MKALNSYYKIIVDRNDKNKLLNAILKNELYYKSCQITGEGFNVLIKVKHLKRYKELVKNEGINAEFILEQGYFFYLKQLKYRFGIFFGLIALICLLYFSSNFVWKIEIEGNKTIDSEKILQELELAGFGLGTYIPDINYDNLHNKILLKSEYLSWVSINITGNVASVKVKEKNIPGNEPTPHYTNIVAKSDAYIESIVLVEGKKIVKVGDVVKKGDLLISGIIDSQAQGVRYEHASGIVKAYTIKNISLKIPFENIKKVYTGKVVREQYYKIYNFPIKFLSNSSNLEGLYDTIEKKEMLCLFGISDLPIEITEIAYYEYFLQNIRYTHSEASQVAHAQLTDELTVALYNSELISKKITTYNDDEYYYLECEIYCLEDIAEEQQIFLS